MRRLEGKVTYVTGFSAMTPMGRGGTVEDVAGGVYLLWTPEPNYISGQTIAVGGGITPYQR